MVGPDPGEAPVIPPVIVPIVHAKVLGAEAVNAMAGLVPLQVLAVGKVVTVGVGLTETLIVYVGPVHNPATEVGVTMY